MLPTTVSVSCPLLGGARQQAGIMGAVGINFGAATSGDGFDVTTTVASIVANLQRVETPWNNQLTSLKADDTALTLHRH